MSTKIARDGYPEPTNKIIRWVANHSGPVCAVTMAVSLGVVGTVAWTSERDASPVPPHVATCHHADGRGQLTCWHYDPQSGWIMNMDNGRTFYVIDTGDVITR